LAEQQDGFRCRNAFRFISFLTELRVIESGALLRFLNGLLDQAAELHIQLDLVHHCVLVGLTTGGVQALLEKEALTELTAIN
jgi:hypothetical protein